MIRVRALRVDYGDVTAVRDLDLEIGGGEIYGLIGPNGAGKTSTIKALAGVLEPTYGERKSTLQSDDPEIEPPRRQGRQAKKRPTRATPWEAWEPFAALREPLYSADCPSRLAAANREGEVREEKHDIHRFHRFHR